jgi:hypothetical protein
MKRTENIEIKLADLLNEVHLTEVQRWRARGAAARAEAFVDLLFAAMRGVRSLAHAIERTSRLPARTAP